ncbi:MAG: hypothetical protein P4L35_09095 [Ignavibacteriaceae bacterium]|nr:hypothetical protein [Ignavibacteriaceae bacterium]
MTNIKIIPNDVVLKLNFRFYTAQQFIYTITILNSKTGQTISKSQGQWDGKTSFQLGKAKDLLGNLLTINWTIIDLAGRGKNINAEAIVTQNNKECLNHISCMGTTKNTTSNIPTSGKFIKASYSFS